MNTALLSQKLHNIVNCSREEWNDWKWQLRNTITSVDDLSALLNLNEEDRTDIYSCLENFKMAITPYYASLIDPMDKNCPIRAQAVPSREELIIREGDMADPLNEEGASPVRGIVHRYPDRVLFLLTYKCAMYCRHCTRRRHVGEDDFSLSEEEINHAVTYISQNGNIRDVLLSGGDPLMLPDAKLESIISLIREIKHVEIIRIGTRVPVVLPMRITDELVNMLKKYHPIWINTHFNHPREITEYSKEALLKMADVGIPLGNQSVLLKGVNNDVEVYKDLLKKLTANRVRPYYLYQCDLSEGIGHFRTTVQEGIEIIRTLRGNIAGFAIPTFVIDAPGGGGKTPMNPEYIISMNSDRVEFKNYKGDTFFYPLAN